MKVLPKNHTEVKHVLVGVDRLVPGRDYNVRLTDTVVTLRSGFPSGYVMTNYYVVTNPDEEDEKKGRTVRQVEGITQTERS